VGFDLWMVTMAQFMKEQSFLDKFGWSFNFLVCGCNGVGDEVILIDDGNKT
jgi:hypothetical protein